MSEKHQSNLDLQVSLRAKDNELAVKNDTIRDLKQKVQNVETKVKSEMQKDSENILNIYKQRAKEAEEDRDKLQERLQTSRKEFDELEVSLQKKLDKTTAQLLALQDQYDQLSQTVNDLLALRVEEGDTQGVPTGPHSLRNLNLKPDSKTLQHLKHLGIQLKVLVMIILHLCNHIVPKILVMMVITKKKKLKEKKLKV